MQGYIAGKHQLPVFLIKSIENTNSLSSIVVLLLCVVCNISNVQLKKIIIKKCVIVSLVL